MNKNLNNWLDKEEGLPKNTSNNNIQKEIKRQKGQLVPTKEEVREYRDSHNNDEIGKNYKITLEEAEYALQNSDNYYYNN